MEVYFHALLLQLIFVHFYKSPFNFKIFNFLFKGFLNYLISFDNKRYLKFNKKKINFK